VVDARQGTVVAGCGSWWTAASNRRSRTPRGDTVRHQAATDLPSVCNGCGCTATFSWQSWRLTGHSNEKLVCRYRILLLGTWVPVLQTGIKLDGRINAQ
jgi:hypothetical protein